MAITSSENSQKEEPLKDEALSAFVTFRIRPSSLRSLSTVVESSHLTRSELIRRTLATGGVVYIGNDLISAIADCRREIAQVGNLLKMLSGELQFFAENPLLADEVKELALALLERVDTEAAAVRGARIQLIHTMERVHDRLKELGNGGL